VFVCLIDERLNEKYIEEHDVSDLFFTFSPTGVKQQLSKRDEILLGKTSV